MIYRILVTGSRRWTNVEALEAALTAAWHDVTQLDGMMLVVHGHARGADRFADAWARRNHIEVERHPADWDTHGRAAGHIRNQHMVTLGAHLCLAFPAGAATGTRDCMRRAKAAGIEVVEVTS
ncbi:SLOG family protein [Streptosporangium sp. NPDC050855]|uniref:SLOG family protein n=1 Tax=Streptosporangium sp. NPDC050855 TaxID=3366194 RepID=UPI0037A4D097